jgi:hypothetical protein
VPLPGILVCRCPVEIHHSHEGGAGGPNVGFLILLGIWRRTELLIELLGGKNWLSPHRDTDWWEAASPYNDPDRVRRLPTKVTELNLRVHGEIVGSVLWRTIGQEDVFRMDAEVENFGPVLHVVVWYVDPSL